MSSLNVKSTEGIKVHRYIPIRKAVRLSPFRQLPRPVFGRRTALLQPLKLHPALRIGLTLVEAGLFGYDLYQYLNPTPGGSQPDPGQWGDPDFWDHTGWIRGNTSPTWNTQIEEVVYGTSNQLTFSPEVEFWHDTAINPSTFNRNVNPTGTTYYVSDIDGWGDAWNQPEGRGFQWGANGNIHDSNANTDTDGYQRLDWWYRPIGVDAATYTGDYLPDNQLYSVPMPFMSPPNYQRAFAGNDTQPLPEEVEDYGLERKFILDTHAPPVLPPSYRAPPAPGERERKAVARGRDLGLRLAKALDLASEAAEIIDAIYEALPEDVKRRWERGRKSRGLADQAGQYGIDGTDWKLQAIYHNLHRLDLPQALWNILENAAEDRLYGSAYGARDRLRPRNFQRNFAT